MEELVLAAKAFADPTRVRLLAALSRTEFCVCELVDALEVTQSTLSNHLQVLRQAGLVSIRKAGKWVYYSLEPRHSTFVSTLLSQYRQGLEADTRYQRDHSRLKQRLDLRAQGRCIRGFAELDALERVKR